MMKMSATFSQKLNGDIQSGYLFPKFNISAINLLNFLFIVVGDISDKLLVFLLGFEHNITQTIILL